MPILPDGQGGNTASYSSLVVTPNGNVNLGSIPINQTGQQLFTLSVTAGNRALTVKSITLSASTVFSFVGGVPTTPISMMYGQSSGRFTFIVQATDAIAETDTVTLTIVWNSGTGIDHTYTAVISATFYTPGGGVYQSVPSAMDFGTAQFNYTAALQPSQVLQINNIGTALYQITNIAMQTGVDFTIISTMVFPINLAAGTNYQLTIRFAPTSATGQLNDNVVITTSIGTFTVAVTGLSVLLIPQAVCNVNTRQMIMAGMNNATQQTFMRLMSAQNLNNENPGTLIFNGSIFGGLGMEKQMNRIHLLYENLGVAVLTFTVKAWRPQIGADSYDVKSVNKTIGTATADGTVRSDYVDLQASGEILELSITRLGGNGAVSFIAVTPMFLARGPKVEAV